MRHNTVNFKGWSGGLNTYNTGWVEGPSKDGNELWESVNCRIVGDGDVQKITGYSKINSSAPQANYVTSMLQYQDNYGVTEFFKICGDKLYRLSGSAFVEQADSFGNTKTLTSNRRASMFTWKEKVFVSNGVDPAFCFGTQLLYGTSCKSVTVNSSIAPNSVTIPQVNLLKPSGTQLLTSYSGYSQYTQGGMFGVVYGSAINASLKRMYVADYTNSVMFVYDTDTTNFLFQFALTGKPTDVQINQSNGYVYVVNESGLITYYNSEGVSVGSFTLNATTTTINKIAVDVTNSKVYFGSDDSEIVYYSNLTGGSGGNVTIAGGGLGTIRVRGITVDETNSKIYLAVWATVTGNQNDYIITTDLALAYSASTISQHTKSTGYGIRVIPSLSLVYHYAGYYYTLTPSGAGTQFWSGQTILGLNSDVLLTTLGADAFKDLGSPGACTVADLAVAGNVTGTFKYKITYQLENGWETTGGVQSGPITVSSSQVHITNIPASPLEGNVYGGYSLTTSPVKYYNIYRSYSSDSGATWGTYHYVDQITIATATDKTVYDDNILNATVLAAEEIPLQNTLVPTMKYLVQFKDCLFGTGDINQPNYLYYTNSVNIDNPNNEDDWQVYGWLPVGEGEVGVVSGLIGYGDSLLIFRDNSIWRIMLTVDESTGVVRPQSVVCVTREYGCASHFTLDYATVGNKNGVIFIDKDKGICFTDGYAVSNIGWKIQPTWNLLNKTLLKNAYGKYYKKRNEYWLTYTASGTTNNAVLIYNTKFGAISGPHTHALCSIASMEDSNGLEQLYGGSFDGYTFNLDSGNDFSTANIDGYFTTPWMSMGTPSNTKVFDKIILDMTQKGSWNMTVYWAVDGNAFSSNNSIDVSLAGTDGVRDKYIIRPVDLNTGRTLTGKSVAVRIRNTVKDQPFDMSGIGFEFRINKAFIP